VDSFSHLFRERAKVNSITVSDCFDDKFLLSFVLDKLRAEFLSMGIYTM